jgi:hypothetical protein
VPVVVRMMRYNILTPNQLSAITAIPLHTILNMCRIGSKKGKNVPPKLTQVGTMPEFKDGEEVIGRLYILRNEQAENLIYQSLEVDEESHL